MRSSVSQSPKSKKQKEETHSATTHRHTHRRNIIIYILMLYVEKSNNKTMMTTMTTIGHVETKIFSFFAVALRCKMLCTNGSAIHKVNVEKRTKSIVRA